MPRKAILEAQQAFKTFKDESQYKNVRQSRVLTDLKAMSQCLHCSKKFTQNATRQFNHLCECQVYLNYCASKGIQNNVTRKVGIRAKPANQLPIHKLSSKAKADLDLRAARVCLVGGYPFTLFESEEMKSFCNGLNSAYKLPSRQRIAGDLLDAVYCDIQADIDAFITSSDKLNIVTDESSNINHSRICNISIQTSAGAIHYISEDVGSKKLDARGCALWLSQHLFSITNSDISQINSIATDTCPTMRKMEKELQISDQFKHIFFIPCDSHSIQLLIKDILSIPRLKAILSNAQDIVIAFNKSPLQYAYLREFQIQCYGKHYSLILSVITRWGTQYRLVHSVLRSKNALRRYADHHSASEISNNAHTIIKDLDFWRDLDSLRELLAPINEQLKMSESSKGHLGHVLERWKAILKHLICKATDIPELTEFVKENGTFAKRFKRQVVPIHILAFYLRPDNVDVPMPVEHETICFQFLERFTQNREDLCTAWAELQQFRAQEETFVKGRPCWIFHDNPRAFWLNMRNYAVVLGNLATRIFSTPTNSVASEHSFSIQNHIHNKLRASLLSKTVNKLTYTYINGRLLRNLELLKNGKKAEDCESLTDEMEVDLENSLLVNEGSEGDLICFNENDDVLMILDEDLDENLSRREPNSGFEDDDEDV